MFGVFVELGVSVSVSVSVISAQFEAVAVFDVMYVITSYVLLSCFMYQWSSSFR